MDKNASAQLPRKPVPCFILTGTLYPTDKILTLSAYYSEHNLSDTVQNYSTRVYIYIYIFRYQGDVIIWSLVFWSKLCLLLLQLVIWHVAGTTCHMTRCQHVIALLRSWWLQIGINAVSVHYVLYLGVHCKWCCHLQTVFDEMYVWYLTMYDNTFIETHCVYNLYI